MHDTLQCLLRLACFPQAVVTMLFLATTAATVHMGGSGGVREAPARILAGVAQGCPASAMVFLCSDGGARFSSTPPGAPVLATRRPLQPVGVYR